MENKYIIILISIILVLFLFAVLSIINPYGKSLTANSVKGLSAKQDTLSNLILKNTNQESQKITLSFADNYLPDTIKVKSGVPVEITLDSSVRGCYRNFIIADLGISLYSEDPSVPIIFTPNQKGDYKFTCCSANMGTGTVIVE